jgi:hypothetical protein
MSAILPKGTRNTAMARRYAVGTQLSKIASMANSLPIEGRAILMEEAINGARKELKVAISSTAFLLFMLILLL